MWSFLLHFYVCCYLWHFVMSVALCIVCYTLLCLLRFLFRSAFKMPCHFCCFVLLSGELRMHLGPVTFSVVFVVLDYVCCLLFQAARHTPQPNTHETGRSDKLSVGASLA